MSDFSAATTRGRARAEIARLFVEAGIDSAALDARVLVAAALGLDHAALVRDPDQPIGAAAAEILRGHVARRLRHEPVSRILGSREFWGLPFAVTPDVLDPRPDTETLVAAVLAALGPRRETPLDILDLGTGSGAILAALLRELPRARGVGVDIAFAACRVARANLAALDLEGRGAIVQASWCDALRGWKSGGGFDVIVSNPPYIESGAIDGLDDAVKVYDPLGALDGGVDGLDPYRVIGQSLRSLGRPGALVAFEIGYRQGAAVKAMLAAAGFALARIERDLAGHDRVVLGQRDASDAIMDD
jgi:release factor glutamine methyltransferase